MAAVLVLTLVDLAPVVSIPLLGGVDDLGDSHDNVSAGGSRGDDRGLESGGRSSNGGRSSDSGLESGVAGSGGSLDRGRCRGSSAVVGLIAGTKSNSDDSVSRASLHAVGIIGSVAVGLLLRGARSRVGGDLPVSIPGVAVDLAQVVPDGSIVLVSVLVLENVLEGRAVRKLDRPAVSVGKRSPGLGVGLGGRQDLVNLGVTTVGRGNVGKSDIVAALVDNNGTSDGVGGGGSHQGGSSVNGVLHFDDWGVFLKSVKDCRVDVMKTLLVETDVASSERVNCTAALLTRAIDRDGQWWWYGKKLIYEQESAVLIYAACPAGGCKLTTPRGLKKTEPPHVEN
jgi:hypothetical protein